MSKVPGRVEISALVVAVHSGEPVNKGFRDSPGPFRSGFRESHVLIDFNDCIMFNKEDGEALSCNGLLYLHCSSKDLAFWGARVGQDVRIFIESTKVVE